MLKEQLQKLAIEKNAPCVSISLNTHRTHPANAQDELVIKNMLNKAKDQVIEEFGKRSVSQLLDRLENVASEIDINYNLDSLHIFLSNDTQEIIKSNWQTHTPGVNISESFDIRPLIKKYVRSESYLVMLLSQSGVQLYEAVNDDIIEEIRNEDFPFSENRHFATNADRASDAKHRDDLVREFLNKVDKALVKVHNETDLKCVVICTEDNYSRLLQVADKPGVYVAYASVNYNNTATHQLAAQSWAIIKELQNEGISKSIEEIKEAVAHGKVITDLQEVFQGAMDGRGELLIVHQDFAQAVMMTSERTFDLIEDPKLPGAIDDITSRIAWEVLSKKGRVVFVSEKEMDGMGKVVLKTRY